MQSFGSIRIEELPVSTVFEPSKALSVSKYGVFDKFLGARKLSEGEQTSTYSEMEELLWQHISSVSSRDAQFHHLYSKAVNTHHRKVKIELMKHVNHMMFADEVFTWFLDQPAHKLHTCKNYDARGECVDDFVPTDFECLRRLIGAYEQECGKFTHYARKYIKYLVRECEQPSMEQHRAEQKIIEACRH